MTATRGASSLSFPVTWTVIAAAPVAAGELPAVIVNEYNSVSSDGWTGSDPAFPGDATNGGDWIELLVTETTDPRGYTIDLYDRDNTFSQLELTDTFTFANHPALTSVAAGTIVTISQQLPDDTDTADYHINANASSDQPGELLTERSNFDTNDTDLHIIIHNANGDAVGPTAGETATWTNTNGDLTNQTVMALCTDPDPAIDSASALETSTQSSFGQPNTCNNGTNQTLDALRIPTGDVNCSGQREIVDALLISQYVVGNRAPADCPLPDPINQINITNADFDNSGTVNIVDALLIAQCIVGNPNLACPTNDD